ncbi:zinc transporter ZitB [Bacilli bacterium]|nr:zinc transporter ZitB [Bacilli bacterium]
MNLRFKMAEKRHSHSHSHESSHSHGRPGANEKAVFGAFLLTFLFMVVEFVGGHISGSLSLMADAGHMLIDATALLLTYSAFHFGRRPASPQKTFGYGRLEIIASLLNSIFLFGLTIFIAYEAFERLSRPTEIMTTPMSIIAIIGLIINCLVFYLLNRGEKDHLNIRVAILHVLGDLLGSVAAVGASIVIYFTHWNPIDSILSVFVCLIILKSVWSLFRSSLNILMEGTPEGIDIEKINRHLSKLPNVKKVCHVHIWTITSGKNIAMVEIETKDENKIRETTKLIKKELANDFNISHSTVGMDI